MAGLELRRYTFEQPGQAPTYYYGLLKLKKLREQIKEQLKDKYSEKCFSDNVLAMGSLPVDIISSYLLKTINCRVVKTVK
ncbi:MAG: hypothetical protein A2504_10160 [Bdellovibrionales bacterium RIFOXYD12_FULL_39_22]|nr:MAG: hypothetical protein A2385_17795 [Bdellovibrionales bacterium RIFOXYB1_FULL_39_21]OFZ43973.1 MAG: hypothetical protein A2485_04465 [Bdellovibrionales bacterium RIFOXYC12_FULL_39_17]OFZ48345.1 MAG: hypothetical protein A2404_01880 [Bdellovibrionales bacterium RIFOXYC1_FULL_39_130]OFZ71837.1 MAG: hypothetical protein A2451_12765 [Bdellovibrionales bacterium RIFOXYC2_FULL_39_8]OFZ76650.1 MAG: hypothetical protein A2560_17475 [Bdellovibrionales bacterium RIFOXYD1_FULL_39_84]OFZ94936.1 MAG: